MLEKILDITNPFWKFMGKLFDAALLNLLWLLTSIPIVTLGASTAALFGGITHIILDARESAISAFGKSWKENWKQASGLFLVFLLLAAVLVFDIFYFGYAQNYLKGTVQAVFCVLFAIILLLVLAAGTYAFLLQVLFENTLLGTLKNAFVLMLSHLPRTLLVLLVNGLYWVLALLSMYYVPSVSILFVLFGIGLMVFLDVLILMPVMRRYLPSDTEFTD